MENEFLDNVEDNTAVRIWSKKLLLDKWDSLAEGYTSELWDFTRISIQIGKAYFRAANIPTFVKKLMNISGMVHPDLRKKVDIFALSIYGLVIFSKALRHINKVVADLFDRLDKRITLVTAILAETFRSFPLKEKAVTQKRDDISEEM
ncbi:hypothetical protein CXB51_007411 [Gossypium anomalum]|uniref:Uncharacterized protein n=1 Tax=Gossypium anomalum TaxID=47600 RepID=A0A8J5ZBY5_9ROSI|nr:hypothetical protein CXB51_007411 [Gossypium anomalum]